jgi:hypothetical protein
MNPAINAQNEVQGPPRTSILKNRYYKLGSGGSSAGLLTIEPIEGEIQLQHIHPRFTHQVQEGAIGGLVNQAPQLVGGQLAGAGHPIDLGDRAGGADMWIET